MLRAAGLLTSSFLLVPVLLAQDLQHTSTVINIEVPVRVHKGEAFVDNLGMADFEVLENGVSQKIEAVYLIRKARIERQEEEKKFGPETGRDFYIFFELTEYTPKLEGALRYFFNSVLAAGDSLTIVTPLKTYRLRGESLALQSKEQILENVLGILRKDILLGGAEYRGVLKDMASVARVLAAQVSESIDGLGTDFVSDDLASSQVVDRSLEEQLDIYATLLARLETLRSLDEEKILEIADRFQGRGGARHLFIFYEREFIPKIDPRLVERYVSLYQGQQMAVVLNIIELFEHKRTLSVDLRRIQRAFADSSIAVHFLYLTTPAKKDRGVYLEEQSGDVFRVFLEMARASGGSAERSSNADFLMKKASEASENYYLLYYSPKDYRPDGKFRNIEVKVRSKSYSVTHRAGYIAD